MRHFLLACALILALLCSVTGPAGAQAPAPAIPPAPAPAATEPAPIPPVTPAHFEDIPVPAGCDFDMDASLVIESPRVKAARLVYKGRVEMLSLARTLRASLEANGWRTLAVNASGSKGITQVYEKGADSLQVAVSESLWNTHVTMTVARVMGASAAASLK
jgi:hypothetical protein